MRRIIWTAVVAVLLCITAVVIAAVQRDYPTVALCVSMLGITFALLSDREGS